LKDQAFWKGHQTIPLFDATKSIEMNYSDEWSIDRNGGNGWQVHFDKDLNSKIAMFICLI
jgi:hypothetical protein